MIDTEGFTPEQRALLGTLIYLPSLTVEVHDALPGPRFTAARQLEDAGLFACLSCAGFIGPGRKTLRVRYALTDAGHLMVRGMLS